MITTLQHDKNGAAYYQSVATINNITVIAEGNTRLQAISGCADMVAERYLNDAVQAIIDNPSRGQAI